MGVRSCLSARTRWRRKNEALVAALQCYAGRQGKDRAALPVTLLTHVALSYPPVSARGFARSVKDLLGCVARALNRTAISRIRDAFVGVLQAVRGRVQQHQIVPDMACDFVAFPARRVCSWPGHPGAV